MPITRPFDLRIPLRDLLQRRALEAYAVVYSKACDWRKCGETHATAHVALKTGCRF